MALYISHTLSLPLSLSLCSRTGLFLEHSLATFTEMLMLLFLERSAVPGTFLEGLFLERSSKLL